MHELQVNERILQVALEHAARERVDRILAIRLRVGQLSPKLQIFEISAKTGQDMKEWAAWLGNEANHCIGSFAASP